MAGEILPAGTSDAFSSCSSEEGGVNPLPEAFPWATDDVLSQELQPEIEAATSSAIMEEEGVEFHDLPESWARFINNEVDQLSQSDADQEMQPGMQARYGSTGFDDGNVSPSGWPSPPSPQVVSPDVASSSRLESASWVRYSPRRHLEVGASGSSRSGSASNPHPRSDEEQYDEQQDDVQPVTRHTTAYLETLDGFVELDAAFLEQLMRLDLKSSSVERNPEKQVEDQSDTKKPRRS